MAAPDVHKILSMWEKGFCATIIGQRLQVSRKLVTRVVAQARSIRDPRAVLHIYPNGEPVGHARRAARLLEEWPTIGMVRVRAIWSER